MSRGHAALHSLYAPSPSRLLESVEVDVGLLITPKSSLFILPMVPFAFGVNSRTSHQIEKGVRETIMWWFVALAIPAFLIGLLCLWLYKSSKEPTAPPSGYLLQEHKDHTWRNFGIAFLVVAVLAGILATLLAFLPAT